MANNYANEIEYFPFENINDKDFIAINCQTNSYYQPNTPTQVLIFLTLVCSFNYKEYGVCDYEKHIAQHNIFYHDIFMFCKTHSG